MMFKGDGARQAWAQQAAPLRTFNMAYNPDIHHRRSIRLRDYDYAGNGAYFVTICVHGRECLFGEITDCEMRLNDAGRLVEDVWKGLPGRFPQVELDEYIIMPNHFHGIIVITDDVEALFAAPGCEESVGALLAAPAFESDQKGKGAASGVNKQGAASSARTLGQIMRSFKSISAIGVNRLLQRQERPLWQRNYYERIIRHEAELDAARKYIAENPMKWAEDKENPGYIPQGRSL
jgi:putative transposase